MIGQSSDLVTLQETLYRSSNPTRRYLHCRRRDWVMKAIHCASQELDSNDRALEIGPGSGVYLPELMAHFSEVVAVDVEPGHLSDLRRKFGESQGLSLIEADIRDNPFPEESFDFVLCSEVIEHIPSTKRVLEAIYRIVKPGGVVVLTTPQKFSILEMCCKVAFLPGVIQLVRLVYREPVLETGHINLMTERELRRQLQLAGFVIQDCTKLGLYLPILAEFGGHLGLAVIQLLERKILGSSLDHLLWTQCYRLAKPTR